MSDQDDTGPGLIDDAAVSLVQYHPCAAKPMRPKRGDEPEKSGSMPLADGVGDVFPDDPAATTGPSEVGKSVGEARTLASKSISRAASSCAVAPGQVLAGRAPDQKVNWSIFITSDAGEIAVQRNPGKPVLENGAGERVDLRERGGLPAKRLPSD